MNRKGFVNSPSAVYQENDVISLIGARHQFNARVFCEFVDSWQLGWFASRSKLYITAMFILILKEMIRISIESTLNIIKLILL